MRVKRGKSKKTGRKRRREKIRTKTTMLRGKRDEESEEDKDGTWQHEDNSGTEKSKNTW